MLEHLSLHDQQRDGVFVDIDIGKIIGYTAYGAFADIIQCTWRELNVFSDRLFGSVESKDIQCPPVEHILFGDIRRGGFIHKKIHHHVEFFIITYFGWVEYLAGNGFYAEEREEIFADHENW
ncbi:hypothetical protein SDC9_210050 [bioreactor metagenome]|uniref:Uncharacterized protein n=1 Tax=bioreactor metagenome TaxID=1076179 RepID=A0A645JSF2_9ZZZZ